MSLTVSTRIPRTGSIGGGAPLLGGPKPPPCPPISPPLDAVCFARPSPSISGTGAHAYYINIHGHNNYYPINQPCTAHAPATALAPRVCTLVPFIIIILIIIVIMIMYSTLCMCSLASQPYISSCACALGRGAGEREEKYVWVTYARFSFPIGM